MGKTASGMGGLSPQDGRRTGETLHVFLDVFRHTVFFPPSVQRPSVLRT